MSWTFESLESWYVVILAALNVVALAAWIGAARCRVIVRAGRTRRVQDGAASEPLAASAAREEAPTAAAPASPTADVRLAAAAASDHHRPVSPNRGEARLREDLERWRRRAEALHVEARA